MPVAPTVIRNTLGHTSCSTLVLFSLFGTVQCSFRPLQNRYKAFFHLRQALKMTHHPPKLKYAVHNFASQNCSCLQYGKITKQLLKTLHVWSSNNEYNFPCFNTCKFISYVIRICYFCDLIFSWKNLVSNLVPQINLNTSLVIIFISIKILSHDVTVTGDARKMCHEISIALHIIIKMSVPIPVFHIQNVIRLSKYLRVARWFVYYFKACSMIPATRLLILLQRGPLRLPSSVFLILRCT